MVMLLVMTTGTLLLVLVLVIVLVFGVPVPYKLHWHLVWQIGQKKKYDVIVQYELLEKFTDMHKL